MELWKLNWSKFPKQGSRVNPLYRTEASRLPGSDSDTRLCYIYPNRPLPFNFLCAFPTFIRCFSLEEPSAESFPVFGSIARANRRGTDECDLRAVGLNPAILLFRVAAYLRSHPDRLSFTFLFSLCLWISASDCRRRRRQGPSDDKPSHRRRAYRLELSVLWKKRRTVTRRFWEWG